MPLQCTGRNWVHYDCCSIHHEGKMGKGWKGPEQVHIVSKIPWRVFRGLDNHTCKSWCYYRFWIEVRFVDFMTFNRQNDGFKLEPFLQDIRTL